MVFPPTSNAMNSVGFSVLHTKMVAYQVGKHAFQWWFHPTGMALNEQNCIFTKLEWGCK